MRRREHRPTLLKSQFHLDHQQGRVGYHHHKKHHHQHNKNNAADVALDDVRGKITGLLVVCTAGQFPLAGVVRFAARRLFFFFFL